MAAADGSMGPPDQPSKPDKQQRKRGRGQSDTKLVDNPQRVAPPASQGKHDDKSTFDAAAIQMQTQSENPPSKPDIASHTHQSPPSVQSVAQSDKPKTKPKQQKKPADDSADPNSRPDLSEDESDLSELGEPGDRLQDFDWEELQSSYHAKLEELAKQEGAVIEDFNNLVEYFGFWASVGADKEVDRGFKRLKTRVAYVDHEEQGLESKRQHYMKVVEAFKSALQLLAN